MSPIQKARFGLAGFVVALTFVVVAHVVGLDLDKLIENGLIIGGAMSGGLSMWGFRQMPTKGEQ